MSPQAKTAEERSIHRRVVNDSDPPGHDAVSLDNRLTMIRRGVLLSSSAVPSKRREPITV
jgi:hypothetical protein